ncbi:MAG: hypothetical protein IH891_10445, partial [Planctomycetes bacterium]|nr:hypothetical protein [Planctomycetota bacterium]
MATISIGTFASVFFWDRLRLAPDFREELFFFPSVTEASFLRFAWVS